ncbi:hypothetical protein GQ600_13698 [Phytophthora cactorum]|nr:hypothetical protein GQ600_13698 [Phytophthora cactorum]
MRSAKGVRSDQPFRAGKQQPLRRYMSVGSSPVALTPNFSSLSPLYPLPGSPHSAGSSPCSTSMDDAVGRLFTQYLPTFFDLLEKFQYQKALLIVEDEEETRWKSWGAVKVMLKLGASCESTYHLMKYVEAELVQTDTIDQMYGKLVVLMNHLADELKPIVARQSRHFSVHTPTPSSTRNGNASGSRDGEKECENDSMLMMEIAMCGDMSYYVELLEQGAEFFSSAIEELSTVHAAIQCEARVAEYDFTRSIVALHRLKVQLRSWSDHIDGVSDYPLFEGNGIDFGAGGEEEGLLLDESNEHYGITSDSMYSNTSFQSSSSLARGHMLNSSLSGESHHASSGVPGVPSSLAESLVSYRGGRYANMGDTSYDIADEMALLERHQSGVSLNSSASPASSETHSTFRRLLSHSSLPRRGGVASALPIRRGLVQKPGDPYLSAGGANSSTPTITLEQAILGGGNGTGGSGGGAATSLGTQSVSNGGGIVGGSTNPVAAEMMASSMKRQERDDGFALPVFQWSKRFYRSLVAKFSLYFHCWLEPFEKKTDYLTLELSRFIKTPLGISYLGLMDVLLSRAQRGDGSIIRVMLILETQALENKGAHYYENGYRCPSSSNALYTRTDQEKQDEQEEQEAKQKAIASAGSANTSGVSSRTHSPASSRGGGASPANGHRRSIDQQTNHALFMRVDREENEEQNDFSELWGLRSWPAVFCYPEGSSPPLDHWPNIVSLIMDNRSSLDSVRPV